MQEAFRMKKFLIVATLVLVGCSMSRAQSGQVAPQEGSKVAAAPGWCMGCTDSQKVNLISREAREKDATANNELPNRPQVTRSRAGQYAEFKTNFLVNNDSDKKIKSIKWECTLLNKTTRDPIHTFSLTTAKTIDPHKSKTLRETVIVPMKKLMGQVVPANQSAQPPRQVEVDEKYQIIEIEYADGSIVRP
jgi:outer membrane murein-binding lipoprotein Lpp